MSNDAAPHIVAIDRLHDGLFIYFETGEQGFFTEALLHTLLSDPRIRYRSPFFALEELQGDSTPARPESDE